MKSYRLLFVVLLLSIAGFVNPVPCKALDITYSSENFSHEFTPDVNRYKWKITEYWDNEVQFYYEVTASYSKRPRKFRVESVGSYKDGTIRGSGKFESDVSDDPVLYETGCIYRTISNSGIEYNSLPEMCRKNHDLCAIAKTLPASLRASLRQEYEAVNNGNPTDAPLPVSPQENSVQNDPDRVKFEVFLPFLYLKPCSMWSFRLELNRWDPESTRKNKWVSWHAGKPFGGFEGDNSECRSITYLKLKPGKYRFTCMAHNGEGWQTPWSRWVEFSVKQKMAISSESGQHILKTPRIVVHRLSQKTPWYLGENHSVSWTSNKVPGKVRIFLVRGKTVAALLNANRYEWSTPGGVDNTGYWRRNLPESIRPDEHYRVLIESVDDPKIRGFSEYFPIRMKLSPTAVEGVMKKRINKVPGGTNIHVPKKPGLKPGHKLPAQRRFLKLKAPLGMETYYIGKTYQIKWQSSGIEGRIRVILVDKNGKKRTLNGMIGTKVSDKHFSWTIGSNIKPGSMYTIYLKTMDGKVKSKKSGGLNIKKKPPPNILKTLSP